MSRKLKVAYKPTNYEQVRACLETLKRFDGRITKHEYKTLRGKAIEGDVAAAYKGLDTILRARG